jgi:hypothetical protein
MFVLSCQHDQSWACHSLPMLSIELLDAMTLYCG